MPASIVIGAPASRIVIGDIDREPPVAGCTGAIDPVPDAAALMPATDPVGTLLDVPAVAPVPAGFVAGDMPCIHCAVEHAGSLSVPHATQRQAHSANNRVLHCMTTLNLSHRLAVNALSTFHNRAKKRDQSCTAVKNSYRCDEFFWEEGPHELHAHRTDRSVGPDPYQRVIGIGSCQARSSPGSAATTRARGRYIRHRPNFRRARGGRGVA